MQNGPSAWNARCMTSSSLPLRPWILTSRSWGGPGRPSIRSERIRLRPVRAAKPARHQPRDDPDGNQASPCLAADAGRRDGRTGAPAGARRRRIAGSLRGHESNTCGARAPFAWERDWVSACPTPQHAGVARGHRPTGSPAGRQGPASARPRPLAPVSRSALPLVGKTASPDGGDGSAAFRTLQTRPPQPASVPTRGPRTSG